MVVLIGANITFEYGPILLGVGLALSRFVIKIAMRRLLSIGGAATLPLGAVVGAPTTALAFAISFALSRPDPLLGDDILLAVAAAVAATDLLALSVWKRAPTVDETEPDEVAK